MTLLSVHSLWNYNFLQLFPYYSSYFFYVQLVNGVCVLGDGLFSLLSVRWAECMSSLYSENLLFVCLSEEAEVGCGALAELTLAIMRSFTIQQRFHISS